MSERGGAFWRRHAERMQTPEYAAGYEWAAEQVRAYDAKVNAALDKFGATSYTQVRPGRIDAYRDGEWVGTFVAPIEDYGDDDDL